MVRNIRSLVRKVASELKDEAIIKQIKKLRHVGLEGTPRWFHIGELPYVEMFIAAGSPSIGNKRTYSVPITAEKWLRSRLEDMVCRKVLQKCVDPTHKIKYYRLV